MIKTLFGSEAFLFALGWRTQFLNTPKTHMPVKYTCCWKSHMCLGVSLLTKFFIKLTVDDGLQLIIN